MTLKFGKVQKFPKAHRARNIFLPSHVEKEVCLSVVNFIAKHSRCVGSAVHPDKHFSPEKFLKKGFSTAKGRRERAHRETFEESVSLIMNLLYV